MYGHIRFRSVSFMLIVNLWFLSGVLSPNPSIGEQTTKDVYIQLPIHGDFIGKAGGDPRLVVSGVDGNPLALHPVPPIGPTNDLYLPLPGSASFPPQEDAQKDDYKLAQMSWGDTAALHSVPVGPEVSLPRDRKGFERRGQAYVIQGNSAVRTGFEKERVDGPGSFIRRPLPLVKFKSLLPRKKVSCFRF